MFTFYRSPDSFCACACMCAGVSAEMTTSYVFFFKIPRRIPERSKNLWRRKKREERGGAGGGGEVRMLKKEDFSLWKKRAEHSCRSVGDVKKENANMLKSQQQETWLNWT